MLESCAYLKGAVYIPCFRFRQKRQLRVSCKHQMAPCSNLNVTSQEVIRHVLLLQLKLQICRMTRAVSLPVGSTCKIVDCGQRRTWFSRLDAFANDVLRNLSRRLKHVLRRSFLDLNDTTPAYSINRSSQLYL